MSRGETKLPVLLRNRPKGDTLVLTGLVTTLDPTAGAKVPVDLTGYTWQAQVRDNLGGKLLASGTVEPVTDYSDGAFTVTISGDDTEDFPQSSVVGVRGTSPTGERSTFLQGELWLLEPSVK